MANELPDYANLDWDDLKRAWDRQSLGDVVMIDGSPLDSASVEAGESVAPACERHEIEMRIGAIGLWHELGEYGCEVSNADLLPYVISNLEEHGIQATKGFLEIGQAHLSRRPSILKIMFGFQRKRAFEWLCPGFDNVTRTDDHIVFQGACYSIAELRKIAENGNA